MSGCEACYADSIAYHLEMTSERYPTWKWDLCFSCHHRIVQWLVNDRPREIFQQFEEGIA